MLSKFSSDYVGKCNTIRHFILGSIRPYCNISQNIACLHCRVSRAVVIHVSRWAARKEDRPSHDLLCWRSFDFIWDLLVIVFQIYFEFGGLSGTINIGYVAFLLLVLNVNDNSKCNLNMTGDRWRWNRSLVFVSYCQWIQVL